MRRSSRKREKQQIKNQTSIASYTLGKAKMADGVDESAQGSEREATAETTTLTLQALRRELQTQRDQIRTDMEGQTLALKGDIATLRNDTKADINALRGELTGELAALRTKQAETERQSEEIGEALSATMDRVNALENNQQTLIKKCKSLQEKCLDLENRSRRRNLRFVGIAEDSENGDIRSFIFTFLREVLGQDNFCSPVVIDRVHRSLGPKPSPAERPRTIVACFHYFIDKQKILDLAKAKGRLMYNGRQVHIFPDVSPEVGRMRAAFNNIKKKFRDVGVSYSLFFPAKLVITVDGTRHTFDSPQAAETFYSRNLAKGD